MTQSKQLAEHKNNNMNVDEDTDADVVGAENVENVVANVAAAATLQSSDAGESGNVVLIILYHI